MSVLVLGVFSYPSALPNLDQDIDPFDFQQQLGNVAFADEEDNEEQKGVDEEEFEEAEDGEELEGVIVSVNTDGSFTIETEDGIFTIFTDSDTEFDDFGSLSDLIPGFGVEVEVILSNSSLVATEIEIEDEEGEQEHEEEQEGVDEEEFEEAEEGEELEGVIVSVNTDGSFTIETEDGIFTIFTDSDTEFDDFGSLSDLIPGFGVEVEVILSNSSLVATEIEIEEDEFEEADEEEEKIRIKVKVKHGDAKVKVKFDDQKHKFVIDFIDEDLLADAILLKVPDLPLTTSQIMDIWDLDIKEYDKDKEMSYTTLIENEDEAIQTALDLIYELQQKIEQLENRIQTLLEKYESGEYFGTVPEVDSEIKSYTISFDGSATSLDDESIVVDAEGEIFIENLLTFGDNISKFRVTGGEISINDTFYDIVFGKIRVSSSGPSGENDSLVLLGQVIDFTNEDDNSTTLKLVINSATSLEGDFGLDPISIEILPQSKIAGQWHLSGSGQLSLLES